MLDTTIKVYATRQIGSLACAGLLALSLFLVDRGEARTPDSFTAGIEAASPYRTHRPMFSGPAEVLDGDTLLVGEIRVRLEGIDAPETGQTCLTRWGQPWPCGVRAAHVLDRLIAGHSVACEDRGADKYGRTLGVCFAGRIELNAEMVRLGFAWAFVRYSLAYVAHEAEARGARAGIWEGYATPAWEHRSTRWATAEPSSPSGCAIKGNVTAGGRIYHMPWSPWYDKIKMDGTRGKRWFCNEAEAINAGWRPAQIH